MAEIDILSDANAKAKGKRPAYFDDPAVDRVLSMLLVTVQELAVTRERLDTVERLLDAKDLVSRQDIDEFRPNKEAADERGFAHRELISRVMRAVEQEVKAMQQSDKTAEELAEEFSR